MWPQHEPHRKYISRQLKSKSHCDWRSVSKSWCRAPSGAHDQILVWQLRSCFSVAPSLTGGRACLLYILLALASAVFLGSESLGTRNHILLSQNWDFHFRRLLRLAGSRCWYSTPPPHEILPTVLLLSHQVSVARTAWRTPLASCSILGMLRSCCLAASVIAEPFPSNGCLCWFQSSFLEQICHNIISSIYYARCVTRLLP
jgi:hypothetical protein